MAYIDLTTAGSVALDSVTVSSAGTEIIGNMTNNVATAGASGAIAGLGSIANIAIIALGGLILLAITMFVIKIVKKKTKSFT